jgi:hypothetical protein
MKQVLIKLIVGVVKHVTINNKLNNNNTNNNSYCTNKLFSA